ncbi:acyltransferase [Novosphingobium sp. TW-4]|uniref:Acyltransferase n=2 Tax=Novosphingobium olei TaxID=2728851 RepID=A0A7Y0G9M0_9SPHN|nr:acyltransferase [Novosphingobium olei]
MMLKSTSEEMLNLDFLRFYASAAIVWHHSHEFLIPEAQRATVGERTAGLALFVDLFFLISGFVIAHVYRGRVTSLPQFGRFMQRRIGRLFPLHLLTFVLAVAMWAVIGRFAHADHAPSNDPSCMVRTVFLAHAIFPGCNGLYYNGVNWSISAEMLMYILFPLLSLAAVRARGGGLFVVLGFTAFVAFLAFRVNDTARVWTDLYPPIRALPSFALGVSASYARDLLARVRGGSWLTVPLVVASTVAAMIGAPGSAQLALIVATGLSAIAADVRGEVLPLVRRLAPLGQLTYSVYLWHGFFILVLLNAAGDKLLHLSPAPMVALMMFTYAAIAIWSYLSWRYFETPARRWVDGLLGGRDKSRPAPSPVGG